MKTLAILLIATFTTNSWVLAQQNDFTLVTSEEYILKSDPTDYGVFPANDGKSTNISYDPGVAITFHMFDQNAKLTGTTTADISAMSSKNLSERMLRVGEHTYWFYSFHDKEAEIHQLFAQKLDLAEGKFSGEPKKLLETKKLDGRNDFNYFNKFHKAEKYNFNLSSNGGLLMIACRYLPEIPDDSKSNLAYGFYVFDASLEKKWGKEIKCPFTEEFSEAAGYAVDSKGNAFMYTKIFEETVKAADGKRRAYHYEILGTDGKGDAFTVMNLKQDGKYINTLSMNENKEGKMICAGFYSNQARESVTDGAFMTVLDLSTNSSAKDQMRFYPYTEEVAKEIESVKAFRKSKNRKDVKKPEDSNMMIDTILFQKDGSMTLCAEEHHFFYAGNIEFNANYSIIAVKIKGDGELEWMKVVPKRKEELSHRKQPGSSSVSGVRIPVSTGPRKPISFRSFIINDQHFFFFLDNDDNLNLAPGKVPATHIGGYGGILVYAKVDNSGNVTKAKLTSKKELGHEVDPFNLKLNDKDELITSGGGRKNILVKATLKK